MPRSHVIGFSHFAPPTPPRIRPARIGPSALETLRVVLAAERLHLGDRQLAVAVLVSLRKQSPHIGATGTRLGSGVSGAGLAGRTE